MTGTREARIMAGTQGTWEFPWCPSGPPGKCRCSGATTINVVTTSFQIISNSPFILQFEAEVSSKLLTAASNEDSPRGVQILQTSKPHVHILGLKMLTGRMVHTEDPKIFRDNVQKNLRPGDLVSESLHTPVLNIGNCLFSCTNQHTHTCVKFLLR